MAKDLYIARLKAVPLFGGMSKKELDLMVRQADHLRYPARYTVVREGTPGEEFWLVVEGELVAADFEGSRGVHHETGARRFGLLLDQRPEHASAAICDGLSLPFLD